MLSFKQYLYESYLIEAGLPPIAGLKIGPPTGVSTPIRPASRPASVGPVGKLGATPAGLNPTASHPEIQVAAAEGPGRTRTIYDPKKAAELKQQRIQAALPSRYTSYKNLIIARRRQQALNRGLGVAKFLFGAPTPIYGKDPKTGKKVVAGFGPMQGGAIPIMMKAYDAGVAARGGVVDDEARSPLLNTIGRAMFMKFGSDTTKSGTVPLNPLVGAGRVAGVAGKIVSSPFDLFHRLRQRMQFANMSRTADAASPFNREMSRLRRQVTSPPVQSSQPMPGQETAEEIRARMRDTFGSSGTNPSVSQAGTRESSRRRMPADALLPGPV